jgi:uncharacterized protein YndB with AHSA1/START domain
MTDLSLEVTQDVPYPPERVFDAWLDPTMLMKFMAPGPGMTVPEAETDPREGGRFRVVMRAPEAGDLPHGGKYLEIDRPNRLVFTWESPFSAEGSTVTIEFDGTEAGGTRVRLVHVRFSDEESRDNHKGGWAAILARLVDTL